MNGNQLYKENEKLIKSQSRLMATRYFMDYDDVEGHALEIFCSALLSFDDTRGAKFTTHLYHQLKTLNNWCKIRYAMRQKESSFQEVVEERLAYHQKYPVHLFDSISTDLSDEAAEIVRAVIDGLLVVPITSHNKKGRLTTKSIQSYLRIEYSKARNVAEEIRNWWKTFELEEAYC